MIRVFWLIILDSMVRSKILAEEYSMDNNRPVAIEIKRGSNIYRNQNPAIFQRPRNIMYTFTNGMNSHMDKFNSPG